MKLTEIRDKWTFVENIGSTSYWLEPTDDGGGETIGPEEVLELGYQLEAENAKLKERERIMLDILVEIYNMIELRIPKYDAPADTKKQDDD